LKRRPGPAVKAKRSKICARNETLLAPRSRRLPRCLRRITSWTSQRPLIRPTRCIRRPSRLRVRVRRRHRREAPP
jgi:hypothetical protein